MKRKHLLLNLVCLAVMLLAGYATLRLTAPNHRITRKNLKAIEFGMAEREVEEIFGVPAGDYSAKKGGSVGYEWYVKEKTAVKKGGNCIPVTFLARDPRAKFWTADETSAWIRFDEAGKVIEIWSSSPGASVGQSFLAKLRRWLGME